MHQEVLDDRTERERREERQRADDDDGRDQQAHEERTVRRQRAGRCRHHSSWRPGCRQPPATGMMNRNRPNSIAEAERQVVPRRVDGDAGEGAAVVLRRARVRIEHLAEAVRTGVVQVRDRRARRIPVPALRERRDDADAREHQNQEGRGQDGEERHLDFLLLDLLADVLRRPADHQAGDEDADDGVEQHAVEARADTAEDHFVGLHVEQRHQAAERRVAVVHAVDGAAARVGRDGGKQRRCGDAEARFLAFHVPARLRGGRRALDAELRQDRIAGLFGRIRDEHAHQEHHRHRPEERPSLARVLHHVAERVGQAGAEHEDQEDLNAGS